MALLKQGRDMIQLPEKNILELCFSRKTKKSDNIGGNEKKRVGKESNMRKTHDIRDERIQTKKDRVNWRGKKKGKQSYAFE